MHSRVSMRRWIGEGFSPPPTTRGGSVPVFYRSDRKKARQQIKGGAASEVKPDTPKQIRMTGTKRKGLSGVSQRQTAGTKTAPSEFII